MPANKDSLGADGRHKVAIVGCGAWGLALACMLGGRGDDVAVWSESSRVAASVNETKRYASLPGARVPCSVTVLCDAGAVCDGADVVIVAVASRWVRSAARILAGVIQPNQLVISVVKGIEEGTLMTMSEVISDELSKNGCVLDRPVVALSGPSHAEEVCIGLPTAVVAACGDEDAARYAQRVLSNEAFRVYTSPDARGAELCGAVKNVIALAAGMASGLGYGDNARAALITRGMREISRLGFALGCDPDTFYGLAGMGDLVVTATSEHSRNYRAGELMARGLSAREAKDRIGQVVEALNVLPALRELVARCGVEMPISATVARVVAGEVAPEAAATALMCRPLKPETAAVPTRRVITYGTFDLLHYGHINLLRRARALGDYLVVALSTDEFNWDSKRKRCYFPYEKRKAMLEAIEYVDLVIPERNWEQKREDVRKYGISTFVMGGDWEGKFDFLREEGCDVVYLPRTPDISTTQIKKDLQS